MYIHTPRTGPDIAHTHTRVASRCGSHSNLLQQDEHCPARHPPNTTARSQVPGPDRSPTHPTARAHHLSGGARQFHWYAAARYGLMRSEHEVFESEFGVAPGRSGSFVVVAGAGAVVVCVLAVVPHRTLLVLDLVAPSPSLRLLVSTCLRFHVSRVRVASGVTVSSTADRTTAADLRPDQ